MTELNSLQQYVADTLEDSFEDYDGDKAACLRDAMRGTDTGWWSDLIYTHDVLMRFVHNRRGITAALADYRNEVGGGYPRHGFDNTDALEAIAASLEEIRENDTLTRAASWLTSFAVEWETYNYALRHGIEV